ALARTVGRHRTIPSGDDSVRLLLRLLLLVLLLLLPLLFLSLAMLRRGEIVSGVIILVSGAGTTSSCCPVSRAHLSVLVLFHQIHKITGGVHIARAPMTQRGKVTHRI